VIVPFRHSATPYVDWGAYYGARPQDGAIIPIDERLTQEDTLNNARFDGLFADLIKNMAKMAADLKDSAEDQQEKASFFAALLDINAQRKGLLMCNMFDTNGAYEGVHGEKALGNNTFSAIGQVDNKCTTPDSIRFRTLDGSCNNPKHPLMGAAGTNFPRNVSFSTVNEGLNQSPPQLPDPHIISEELLSRNGLQSITLADGKIVNGPHINGNYRRAPFLNLLAGAWIQFMTHDWFAHTRAIRDGDGRAKKGLNDPDPANWISTSQMILPGTLLGSVHPELKTA
jgi:hypothetical protein